MEDCLVSGPLPSWAASNLAHRLRDALVPLDLQALVEKLPTPSQEWLTADPGTRSRRRRKGARNADIRRRGHNCSRCGTSERIQLHHVLPMYVSDLQGKWRETHRETIDLCVPCHRLLEAATARVLPVTKICDRWAVAQIEGHPEWLDLAERPIIESRVIRWALYHLGSERYLSEAYRLASRLFLELEVPISDRRALRWHLHHRLGQYCQRCATDSGLLYIVSLPFSFLPQAVDIGFDPLDPAVGATLCHPCARSYVHQATELSDPEKDLPLAIEARTALLRDWIKQNDS